MDCALVGQIVTRVEKWTVGHARSLLFFDSSSGRRPLTRCGRSRLGGPHRLGRPWRGARRLLLCGCSRGRGSCRDNGPRRRGPRGHGGGPAVPARFHAEEGDCVRVAVDVVVPKGKLAARNGHARPRVGEARVSDVGARATCAARHGAVLPDFFREVVARAITPRGELGARVSITGCVQLQLQLYNCNRTTKEMTVVIRAIVTVQSCGRNVIFTRTPARAARENEPMQRFLAIRG